MRGRRLAIACLVLGTAVAPAGAQPADDTEAPTEEGEAPPAPVKDPKLAKKWRDTGTQLVQRGDALTRQKKPDDAKVQYENARTAYEKALDAGADMVVRYELGVVFDKLGKFDEAVKQYRLVVKPGSGAKPADVKRATTKLDDATTKVGLVTLMVKPEGATVSIGGNEVGKTPLADPLVLMPGTYTIAFAADGFQPKETEIVVEAGSESERTIELEAVKIIVEAPRPREDEEPAPTVAPDGPSKVPLYLGGGATIALVAVATVTGLAARSAHDTFTAPESTANERADAQDRGKRMALVTDLCIGGAVVAAGVTAYWYFAKYRPAQREQAAERAAKLEPKLDVVPWVKVDAGGFAVAGSF